MDSSQTSAPSSSPNVSLPPGFLTIEQIQQLPSQALKDKQKLNVIGFLKDFQPPIQSRGTDFKCTIDIVDSSLPYGSFGIKANIFWKNKDEMPKIDGVGDVVLIRNIKAQMWAGTVSLLSHLSTEVHILAASKVPKASPRSLDGLWRSYLSKRQRPTDTETAYVIEASAKAEDLALPSTWQFQERSIQAMNVKNKFALLKDVKPDGFYDILGEVIRVYGETFDSATVYLSDYTENSLFYNHPWAEVHASNSRDGDEHGYLKSRPKTAKDVWPGPYGKRTIQLTLWDAHATFVKEQVRVKSWVLLRNVQIKLGKSGQHLEGFLRGDQNAIEGKIQVEVMERSEEPNDNDSRWKEAISRKYEWEKKFKQQKDAILGEFAGTKRKQKDEPCKGNSKARRKERRAAGLGKAAATEAKVMKKLDLNENIRSSNPDESTVPLAEILKFWKLPCQAGSGRHQTSPFHVCKYKANVRVVGYFPPKVEDFAVGHRPSEFDMLSDYSGGEDTDPEEDMRAYRSGKGFPKKVWEWRFALEVIDASDKISGERMWLVVENQDAQMLLNMDATNLRKDPDALQAVKEQLCVLWGDLEEQKSALARTNTPKSHIPSSMEPKSSPSPYHKPGDQPPIDSDDEDQVERKGGALGIKPVNAGILSERDSNIDTKTPPSAASNQKVSAELQVKNKAFTCCIKQYGVKVKEHDPSLANAGNGKRWQRKFGLFGTQIV